MVVRSKAKFCKLILKDFPWTLLLYMTQDVYNAIHVNKQQKSELQYHSAAASGHFQSNGNLKALVLSEGDRRLPRFRKSAKREASTAIRLSLV